MQKISDCSSLEPSIKTRRPKAPTLREADWVPHKSRIVHLHITDNKPLKDVRIIMQRDHGFNAEIRQYRTRISKWKLDKNIKPKEMKAIVRKTQHRNLVEVDRASLRFKVRGQEVEQEKITRWMRTHDVSHHNLYAPSSVACECAFCGSGTWLTLYSDSVRG
ncbi:hypothetical protein BU25DRAFT_393898 [Macroventuria anomochaeta]|uniref:Uncharacterized protein n=1 Tax=Macroventuria anomochaeta TaxID=301207 RepID=A0ACB6S0K0_9PLEO|nr:uncharacterized protein BU25DRAFT_393898 [Macroventuria anomochaeta]KAF2627190.1 hypothetical protein BU25DRAFT_393898 [Macroventuria anomochaeta]